MSPANFTNDTLTSLLTSLEASLSKLESQYKDSLAVSSSSAKQPVPTVTSEEVERLQEVVQTLQSQLGMSP